MKVNPDSQLNNSKPQKKLSKNDIQQKIQAKFGEKAQVKKAKPPVVDKVELESSGVKSSNKPGFGDVGVNDPNAEMTQEKLKGILKSGGFDFNERERKALTTILK
ncbi:MAG: hypothetical protein HON90_04190 [Halobacteriovoraceae bacterium]|jgi:hypothetical protein|nr:hypothetical protein [Halobacteriovoraceae bacterium]